MGVFWNRAEAKSVDKPGQAASSVTRRLGDAGAMTKFVLLSCDPEAALFGITTCNMQPVCTCCPSLINLFLIWLERLCFQITPSWVAENKQTSQTLVRLSLSSAHCQSSASGCVGQNAVAFPLAAHHRVFSEKLSVRSQWLQPGLLPKSDATSTPLAVIAKSLTVAPHFNTKLLPDPLNCKRSNPFHLLSLILFFLFIFFINLSSYSHSVGHWLC